MALPDSYLQMTSTLNDAGTLRLQLVEKPMPTPKTG